MWRRISTVFMTVGIMMMLAFRVINTQEQVTTQLSLTSSGSKTNTTQPFLCTTKPATSIYPSSKPQHTSETTIGRSTPDDSRTKSTTQESTSTRSLSSSEPQTVSAIVPTEWHTSIEISTTQQTSSEYRTTSMNLKTTKSSPTSNGPSTSSYLSSEPKYTSKTTQTKQTSQESSTSGFSSTLFPWTASLTTFMPTELTESSRSHGTSTTMSTMQTTGESPSTATSSTSTNPDISSPLPSIIPPMTTHMSHTSSKSQESSTTPETATTMSTMQTTGDSPSTATSSTSTNPDISSPLPSIIPPMTTHMSHTSSKSQESSTTPETATTMSTMQTTGNSPSTATSSTSTNTDISSPLPSTIPSVTSSGFSTETPFNPETTHSSFTSNEPTTMSVSTSSKPPLTSETTSTFVRTTPNEYTTESTSLNPTFVTTIMSTESTESNTSPETLTTGLTMETTENTHSTVSFTSSTSSATELYTSPETLTTGLTMQTTDNTHSPATFTSSTSRATPRTPTPATLTPGITSSPTQSKPPFKTSTVVSTSISIQTQTSYPATTTERTTTERTTITKSTPTSTSNSTATPCRDEDCQCLMGMCIFSTELSRCHCVCQEGIFGDTCNLGPNYISPDIDTTAIPDRKVNITLDIKIPFLDVLSSRSNFNDTLVKKLEPLCKEADPQAFKKAQVVELLPGNVIEARRMERSLSGQPKIQFSEMLFKKSRSLLKKGDPRVDSIESPPRSVLATSQAQYAYQNNATQINWLNTQLDGTLTQILMDSDNIQQISQAFGNTSVLFKEVVSPTPQINNITDIERFVSCSRFPNYTAEVIAGRWQCVALCNKMPDYCSGHGKCHNDLRKGTVCSCDRSSIREYYGQRCDRSRWGPGFYGALFGSLAAALLIIIIVILVVFLVKKRRSGMWKRTDGGFIDFEEDYFDFTNIGNNKK
ncbi:uncharacterized protein ACBT44_015987 isoform 2-T3 [Syngnathus typhle]